MVVGSQLRMVLECDEGCHGTNKRMQARKSLFSAGTTVTGLTTVYATPTDVDTMRLWHMRLNHMSEKGMTILSEKDRLGNAGTGKLEFCDHYVFGKENRISFSTTKYHTQGILDYIHSDLWGLSSVSSFGGKCYMLKFVDDFSRKVLFYFLRQKNETLSIFKKFKALVENRTGRKIKKRKIDNGLEFCKLEFTEFCAVNGAARHKPLVGKPQQNGVVEDINLNLLEKARCMLSNTGLWDCKALWAETVLTTCYLMN